MKTIQSAIKQAIFSKDFLIGFIGVIVVVFVSSVSDLLEELRWMCETFSVNDLL